MPGTEDKFTTEKLNMATKAGHKLTTHKLYGGKFTTDVPIKAIKPGKNKVKTSYKLFPAYHKVFQNLRERVRI